MKHDGAANTIKVVILVTVTVFGDSFPKRLPQSLISVARESITVRNGQFLETLPRPVVNGFYSVCHGL